MDEIIMGLDVACFKDVKSVSKNAKNAVTLYPADGFKEHFGELKEGRYKGEIVANFNVGPYMYYNAWREWLSETFLNVPPRTVWNNPSAYKEKPFYWLIDFADNEGSIANPIAIQQLRKAFASNDPPAQTNREFKKTYQQFKHCVMNSNVIQFH